MKHQAKLSGRAKDTVTRSAVMILVSDHTYTPTQPPPPTEILSAFRQLCSLQLLISAVAAAAAANSLGMAAPLNLAGYRSSRWTLALFSGIGRRRPAAFRAFPGYRLSPATAFQSTQTLVLVKFGPEMHDGLLAVFA